MANGPEQRQAPTEWASRMRDKRILRREQGLCYDCGGKRDRPGYSRCEACVEKYHRSKIRNMRIRIYAHYGNKCSCCGETEPLFFELDHVNGNGADQRRELGKSMLALFLWIIRNNFPPSIQILCSNCNLGKQRNNGVCPHVTQTT